MSLWNGDNGDNGDNGGLLPSSGFVGRLVSPYTSGAMINTADGIVGPWNPPTKEPRNIIDPMRRWETRVRRHVVSFDILSTLEVLEPNDGTVEVRTRFCKAADARLVKLSRPSPENILKDQLPHIRTYADLRRDRSAEILSQLSDLVTFFGSVGFLRPDRTRFTLELIAALMDALVPIEMRVKHALAAPRPLEYSAQVMPMIQTPGHSSFPSGHAIEAFMIATVLAELMEGQLDHVYADGPQWGWRHQLMRLAARIAENRVVAGVHFPVDNAAGMVMGLQLGRYFVELAKGSDDEFHSCEFNGNAYGKLDFPWRKVVNDLSPTPVFARCEQDADAPFLTRSPEKLALGLAKGCNHPLRWMWNNAVEEWNNPASAGDST